MTDSGRRVLTTDGKPIEEVQGMRGHVFGRRIDAIGRRPFIARRMVAVS